MEAINAADGSRIVLGRMRGQRLSCKQFDVLMDFMTAHPHFAVGRARGSAGVTSREENEMLWKTLTSELNATDGPTKPIYKWQKCWVDLKSNARSRVAKLRAAAANPSAEVVAPALTQWDYRLLSLMGPAYDDILSMYNENMQQQPVLDQLHVNEFLGSNSNSSYHDQEPNHQDLESQNGIKVEEEDDIQEIIYEEELKNMEENEYNDNAQEEDYISLQNGDHTEKNRIHPTISSLSPSVTLSPLTLVSSSTTHGSRPPESFPEANMSLTNTRKRKADATQENNYEKFPKGTLDILERLSNAAEESIAIQRQVAGALNKLSDSFAQIVPLLTRFVNSSHQRK